MTMFFFQLKYTKFMYTNNLTSSKKFEFQTLFYLRYDHNKCYNSYFIWFIKYRW